MPLARHDTVKLYGFCSSLVSTHMPLARHDDSGFNFHINNVVSTHMPLARHDADGKKLIKAFLGFYSHASCEA